jgi:hypothetical protein
MGCGFIETLEVYIGYDKKYYLIFRLYRKCYNTYIGRENNEVKQIVELEVYFGCSGYTYNNIFLKYS